MAEREVPTIERLEQHWRYGDIAWLRSGELLFTADITGQSNLWHQIVGPKGERGFAQPLTTYTDRSVRTITPSPDGRSIIYTADQDGDEKVQIYRIGGQGGAAKAISTDRTVPHFVAPGGLDPTGRRLLYSDTARTASDLDVVLLDLARGTSARPLPEGALWSDATWDPTGRRFSVLQVRSNTRIHSFVHDVAKGTTVEVIPHESEDWVAAEGWTRDGRSLLVRTDLDREFKQLELVDLASGERRVIAAGKGDVENVAFSAKTSMLVYCVNENGFSKLYAGRLGSRAHVVTSLPRGCRTNLVWGNPLALSPDGKTAAINWETGTGPPEIRSFSLTGPQASQLSESMVGGVPDAPLPAPRPVRFQSTDGRWVPAFYMLPKRRTEEKMPAVLSIHGGPESQTRPEWGFSGTLHAWLNAQGIAVLAPNIRGSTGYGKTYQRLIHHDWGGGELQDLQAAAEWLRARPEIDPTRLGVYGASFGGFATLSCVTRLPRYWKVGVDLFGPSNLLTFVRSVPPFWVRFMDEWVGNPNTEPDFLRDRSPITYIDNVRADLLIVQGGNDPRVNRAESEQMVERLKASGRKVEYVVFEDEGHGFTRRSNELIATAAVGRFLADHLLS
jgi:dipeptidyl aminopeptidase/acylaminoacyl peptidase